MDRRLLGRTILQIVPRLDAGGAEQTTLDVAEAIAHAGGRAIVLSEGGRLVEQLRSRGGEFFRFPAASKNPLRMLANAQRLKRIIKRNKVDIVHARSRAPAWSALLAARGAHVPFVTTYHGIYRDALGPRRLYNSVMARGDLVIANSLATADFIRSRHGTPTERMVVIPRGADFNAKFHPARINDDRIAAVRARWAVPDGCRIVLLPGRLARWKGQEVLIEAASRIAEAQPDAIFVMAGDPQGRDSYEQGLHSLAAARGLADRIRLPGHETDMPAAYSAADVVVSASIEPEAFGRVAVEAQAMGTPTVVTELGATGETMLAPPDCDPALRTGWRVPPADPDALADAIAEALGLSGTARRDYARRARAHVLAHFTLHAMTGATLEVYSSLLGDRPS